MKAVGHEVIKGGNYATALAAPVGLWWFPRRLRATPGAWVVLLLCGMLALVLWRVAVVVGYVSDRHTLLLILCGTFWAVAALRKLPILTAALARRLHAWPFLGRALTLAGRQDRRYDRSGKGWPRSKRTIGGSRTSVGMAEPGSRDGEGLIGMRDRIGAVGGELRIVSSPGAGTTARATRPSCPARSRRRRSGRIEAP